MSEILKEILRYCPYKEPEETQFYTMLRRGMGYEVECNGRDGYTVNYKDFGIFDRDSAHDNVEYMEGNGCLRFNIEKDLLDSIVNQLQSLQEQRDLAVEALSNMPCDYVAIETTTGVTSVHAEYCNKCKALKKIGALNE